MVSWVRDFSNTYHTRTGRYVTLYPRSLLFSRTKRIREQIPDNLHHHRLVEDLHRQQRRVRLDEPVMACEVFEQCWDFACWLVVSSLLTMLLLRPIGIVIFARV